METTLRVRKGVWTEEEDDILRKCIKRYGEGNWYQVPSRAGLNRCRKSCRLRWLNYLKPNIKRGEFQEDEVDLILRLHKLLGNRWSLIAGRLPGRTANDVKNYWNTHLKKKEEVNASRSPMYHRKHTKTRNAVKVNVIKPRPRAFKKFPPITAISVSCSALSSPPVTPAPQQPQVVPLEHDISWWERLLSEGTGGATASRNHCADSEQGEAATGGLWCPDMGWNQNNYYDMGHSCWEFLCGNNEPIGQ